MSKRLSTSRFFPLLSYESGVEKAHGRIERRRIESRTIWHVISSRVGEPLRFGWEPSALREWLRSRGFELVSDRGDDELARELFPRRWVDPLRGFHGAGGRIALARPA